MNLPNSLTLVRMFLVPLLVVVLLTEFEGRKILGMPKELVGAAIFGLASMTDWLDGYIARRRRQVTWLGQMLDPIADKLLTSAAFISLVQLGLAPAWMVALIIGREFAITALRSSSKAFCCASREARFAENAASGFIAKASLDDTPTDEKSIQPDALITVHAASASRARRPVWRGGPGFRT